MFLIKIAVTLVYLILVILFISKKYKKLDQKDKKTFKKELVFETGFLYLGKFYL